MTDAIAVLGSTGSIGRQTLEVAGELGLRVGALTAGRNVELMERQARKYLPKLVVMSDRLAARNLKIRLQDTPVEVAFGEQAERDASSAAPVTVCAVSGMAALPGVMAAAAAGGRVALANKESLVCAGSLIKETAARSGAEIIPVDSEHSAIFQCLQGNADRAEVARLILTASGGPFFGMTPAQLEKVTVKEALAHPNWSMGPKITIDSATMMNKGLEVIEAMRLYDMPLEKIDVVIHRESIIHSLVEYVDGALIAQLGAPDMRLPIQYALTYPKRLPSPAHILDLASCGLLSFSRPDMEGFPCLKTAMETSVRGEAACTVMNAANEEAVSAFIREYIGFTDIHAVTAEVLERTDCPTECGGLDEIMEYDSIARELAKKLILQRGK
ncbi:MAG: 1-deoxy-D-xylulose-5-phosphate reductoisomerase [Oscillospiraceae bacterium]|nr:1-deoxy-D-xylulose-5-phosphate reductoisomerase [Oscillospiraceae bacterium]